MRTNLEPLVHRVRHSGALIVSDYVTDGCQTWMHTITFYDYGRDEAIERFYNDVDERALTVAS